MVAVAAAAVAAEEDGSAPAGAEALDLEAAPSRESRESPSLRSSNARRKRRSVRPWRSCRRPLPTATCCSRRLRPSQSANLVLRKTRIDLFILNTSLCSRLPRHRRKAISRARPRGAIAATPMVHTRTSSLPPRSLSSTCFCSSAP